ncbi:zinc ribbon domain-containing protein [Streptomyces sp. NBC_00102]|uniref:NADase-type glycan-binding domain-containing protein n=1 Tax=Streptomyces sp. NBC_00102 TaxID=2975652 RepID=UPI0022585C40|nr:zinc ribbon domain-containing protein [Streptomyces sp. NBC_00102]MCX5398706.1 zinc ribbon domain-containing protein [Streptomyces sp. NBC_00102]
MTTQNCAECGTRAEPGLSFCDACGAVLSWADRSGTPAGAADGARGHGTGAGTASGEAPEPSFAASSASSAASSPSAPADGPSPAGPGWDAFARTGGGAGLPRQSRRPQDSEPLAHGGSPRSGPYDDGHAAPAERTRPSGGGADEDREESDTQEVPGVTDDWAARMAARRADGGAVDDDWPSGGRAGAADDWPSGGTAGAADDWPAAGAGAGAAAGADDREMSDRARRLIVPVADPGPAAEPTAAPVLPGRPAPQRPQAVHAPGEQLGVDGGTPCPWCSTPNRHDRHYCVRCAMPMAGDRHVDPSRLPWWRRMLNTRTRETPWAGDRPRVRRAFDRVLGWVGAAIVVTLVIVAAVHVPDGVRATRDHFSKRAPVSPDHVSASRSYPGHKPDSTFDKLNNTWWGPGVSESGKGQWIEAGFDSPTRLLNVIVMPGVSKRADQNTEQALPHRVDVTITQSSGKVTHRELVLDDGAGGQTRNFRFDDVTKVRFTVVSAYHTSAKKQVAFAEIEFFGPSHNGDN